MVSRIALCLLCLLPVATLNAQMLTGITHKPDTSYTSFSAYQKDKRFHPEIRLVKDFGYKDVLVRKNISYCTAGSHHLMMDVFMPAKISGKKIAVIIVHGGGWRSGDRSQHYPLAESLAHLGYICFTPEYRLSTEALFPAAVYDIKSAVRWVRANAAAYHVDTARIVIAGFSSGGELAAFAATTGDMPLFEGDECNIGYGSHVNALIDIDGTLSFVHPESGEGVDSPKISAATYWFGYSKKEDPELWKSASPLSYAGAHTPPTLFLNSSVARMHAGRDDYIRLLSRYHIYTEAHCFSDAPHSFPLYYPWFDPMVKYIDGFLKRVF